jgi:hypothetical protein
MAKVKRANHRSGAERPRWAANGTGPDGSEWNPEDGPREAQELQESEEQPGKPEAGLTDPSAKLAMPVRLDEIAVAAMALSDGVQAATQGLPESVESRRFRRELDDAAGAFRAVASELETTAGDLVRLAAAEGESCGVTWGICPDHGITLIEVGDVVTCRVLGCGAEQTGPVERCPQPAAYRVVDASGPALQTCTGHAIACRMQLEGAVITLASDSLELL